jgi:hypothetical protein
MFTKIRNIIESPGQPSRHSNQWLPSPYANLLWRLELIVETPPIANLDADAFWSKDAGGGIVTEKHGKTQRRLRQALTDHCHWTNRQDSQSGKLIKEERTFTDVIACLHPDVYNKALITHEQTHINALLHNLAVNHAKDFQASLPKNRKPRYLARPDPRLEKNSVAFLFGPTVYIPDPEESIFQIVPSLNGNHLLLPDLEYWRDGKSHRLPLGFYAGQEFLLLVPEQGEGLITIPGWRSASKETYLLLRRIGADRWTAVLGETNQHFNLSKKALAGIWYSAIPLNENQTLTLEIAAQSGAATPQHNPGKTIIFGLTDPDSPYALTLEAVGLPALFRGLRQWTLWLDSKGDLAPPTTIHGRQQLASLSLNQSGLFFTDESGVSTALGTRIDQLREMTLRSATRLTLLPAPEGLAHFIGLLRLSTPDRYPVSETFTTIGRFDPNSTDNPPDILLDQLDQPGSLIGQGIPPGTTLNNLGLSRRHVQVRVNGDRLEAKLENHGNPIHQLNSDGKKIDTRFKSTDPLTLELDHYLVLGNFIFCFGKNDG